MKSELMPINGRGGVREAMMSFLGQFGPKSLVVSHWSVVMRPQIATTDTNDCPQCRGTENIPTCPRTVQEQFSKIRKIVTCRLSFDTCDSHPNCLKNFLSATLQTI